jgi:hypothetical protein
MPAGRPSEYNETICNYILEQIELGRSVKSICDEEDMPNRSTFYRWVDCNEELRNKYDTLIKNDNYKAIVRCKSNPKGSRAKSKNDYRVRNAREQNKKRYPKSDIYIFRMGELGIYKIGVSQNVNRRLRDINAANPFSVEVLYFLSVTDAYDLEDKIHKAYEGAALQNEWFALSQNDVTKIIQTIIEWQKQPLGTGLQYALAI